MVESLSSDDDDNGPAGGPPALPAPVAALALPAPSRPGAGSSGANPVVID